MLPDFLFGFAKVSGGGRAGEKGGGTDSVLPVIQPLWVFVSREADSIMLLNCKYSLYMLTAFYAFIFSLLL